MYGNPSSLHQPPLSSPGSLQSLPQSSSRDSLHDSHLKAAIGKTVKPNRLLSSEGSLAMFALGVTESVSNFNQKANCAFFSE